MSAGGSWKSIFTNWTGSELTHGVGWLMYGRMWLKASSSVLRSHRCGLTRHGIIRASRCINDIDITVDELQGKSDISAGIEHVHKAAQCI